MSSDSASRRLLSLEVLSSLLQSGKYVDPVTAVEIAARTVNAVLRDAALRGLGDKESIEALIESISSSAPAHAIINNSLAIAVEIVDAAENGPRALERLKIFADMLVDYASALLRSGIGRQCKRLIGHKGKKISVSLMGYSRLAFYCIESVIKRVHVLNILEARPQGDGIVSYKAAGKLGIKARLFPDIAAGRVAADSDMVVVPVDTVSYDGYALVRMGLKQLVLAASDQAKTVIGLAPGLALTPTISVITEPVMSTKVYVRELNDYISVKLYDKIKTNLFTFIVTEEKVLKPGETDIEDESYTVIERMISRVTGEAE